MQSDCLLGTAKVLWPLIPCLLVVPPWATAHAGGLLGRGRKDGSRFLRLCAWVGGGGHRLGPVGSRLCCPGGSGGCEWEWG